MNPLTSIDNFIFDMDGTILNSSVEVLKCIRKAYDELNIPYDVLKVSTDVIGPPLRGIFQLISPEIKDSQVLDRLESVYGKYYDFNDDDSSVLYDGILDFLYVLKKRNKNLFIATNKPAIPTIRLVKSFNLDFFVDVYTIDKFENKQINKEMMIKDIIDKHALDKSKTVMIGDAFGDVNAGKLNDVLSVGVLWGYSKNKKSLVEASDIVVSSVSELAALI